MPPPPVALTLRTRVELHSLSKESFNGRIGVVTAGADNDRLAVRLSKTETLALKRRNLKPLPSPTIPIVLVGVDEPDGLALLKHILERREELLLARGAFVAVTALSGRDGAVHPARRTEDFHSRRSAEAPHGGLDDATLARAAAGGLAKCDGYRGSTASATASHRRLGPALSTAAAPSLMVLDVSRDAAGVKLLVTGDAFRPERWGGVCIARRADGAAPATAAAAEDWLHWLPGGASPEEVLSAALTAFTGWLRPLAPAPENVRFTTCMWCGDRLAPEAATCCGDCRAVCYCSHGCMLGELTDSRSHAICHAAYCKAFERSMARDAAIALPGAPRWLSTCMEHGGSVGSECALLRKVGIHQRPYTLFCTCEHDDAVRGGGMAGEPLPKDFSLALAATLASALPPAPPSAAAGGDFTPHVPLASWGEYYAYRGVAPDSPVSLLLSFAMTVYHALDLVGAIGSPASTLAGAAGGAAGGEDARVLHVHYIGAAAREHALLPTFFELAHLLPATKLRLLMVGPALPRGTPPTERVEGCLGGWVEVAWHSGLYHEGDLGTPTLAVAPNSGIHEYEEWNQTIAFLDERRIPFVFTDYSEIGLLAAGLTIREEHGLRLSIAPRLNPFRQPMNRGLLIPPGGTIGVPWMGNGFVAAILTEGRTATSAVEVA